MKLKRFAAFAAAAMIALSGCGGDKSTGKVSFSVGDWPDETNTAALETKNKMRDDFMASNPDIEMLTDTYKYETQTFTMKASANQLPTMFNTWFTEVSQIIDQGNAADITEVMKKHKFDVCINPELLKFVTTDDGKIYGIPTDAYMQALYINKQLFKEAGLVNDDGSIKEPDTWQDVAEFAKIIKEKTGKAGFAYPTINNCGGWMFLNIAWAYGTEFEKQREDGTWEATFNTQETKDALQFIKDLKWKYNALLDDSVVSQADMYKYFGTNQAAMMIRDVPFSAYSFGMDNSNLYATKMPKGNAGRFTQMGGNLWMFAKNATKEQIEAGFKWLEFTGFSPEMTDAQAEQYRNTCQEKVENNEVVIEREAVDIWSNPETVEKRNSIRKEYANVDYNDYKNYFEASDIEVKLEPAACAQQLYAVLDKCIQEVISNENADVDKLISDACSEFQINHLDKMK